ncbi:L-rhamnose mutarotase [Sphingobacterium griseoflavum]|uniref:L-rhamnose mutarotase n=1 Tax=Sphingobacterium griseoflavum TaxID=1474952 RepID=A0ABQ3I370_9SPHI|nr:L-rhamnose mutarotase [Sphingobacterium griseoflavum]GHE45211.1 hypothetical protein GCM10017764_30660 [Sphingobacterium griseoflavum]
MEIKDRYGAVQKNYAQPIKRYCQTLDLIDDAELIAKYVAAHSEEVHWQEIREGIKQVGILEMEIYLLENKLFMIVETGVDFQWEDAFNILATLPRQQEWECWMSSFQQSKKGSTDKKWRLMDRIFHLYPRIS